MVEELKGKKILCWGTKISQPQLRKHPLYRNHRCQHVKVKGGGGRPAFAMLIAEVKAIDREKALKELD